MSMATITKVFTFDAAHQLPHHQGKCARLHGHTYRVEVTAGGLVWPADGSPSEGMVVDFDEINKVFKSVVDAECDHRFMIPLKNPDVHVAPLEAGFFKVKVGHSRYDLRATDYALLPIENTTAECLAQWILEELHDRLSWVIGVRVYETPTSSAYVKWES